MPQQPKQYLNPEISHKEAMAVLDWASNVTFTPTKFAIEDYEKLRAQGESRLEAVTIVVESLIAEKGGYLLNDIIARRKNYMEG